MALVKPPQRSIAEIAATSPMVRALTNALTCQECRAATGAVSAVLFDGELRRFRCTRDASHNPSPNVNRRLAATLVRRERRDAYSRRNTP